MFSPSYEPPAQKRAVEAWGQHSQGLEGAAGLHIGPKKAQKLQKKWKIHVFTKTVFFTIQVGIWEVLGCPGGGHGPYEEIPSNFGKVWSYRTWGKSIFMFFGKIGNSLHHQIHPNWSSGLLIGPRIFLKAWVPSQELSNKLFLQQVTPKRNVPGNWATSQNHNRTQPFIGATGGGGARNR
jgi:hypothetical protein